MNGDWRIWRPAIWLAMLGAIWFLIPWRYYYLGIVFIGAGIGVAIRITQRRRRR